MREDDPSEMFEAALDGLTGPRSPRAVYRVQLTPSFGFEAAAELVAYLDALGVSDLYTSPIFKAVTGSLHGYDLVDPNRLNPELGSPEAFDDLTDRLSARGMGLLLDFVPNHMGVARGENAYWLDVLENGPSSIHASRRMTPWGEAIDVDGPGAEPVRELLVGSAAMWIERYHLDGLRLDATHAIEDSGPVHILRKIGERVREAGGARSTVVIAEDERNEASLVRSVEAGGLGLDAVWSDDLYYQLSLAFGGEVGIFGEDFRTW